MKPALSSSAKPNAQGATDEFYTIPLQPLQQPSSGKHFHLWDEGLSSPSLDYVSGEQDVLSTLPPIWRTPRDLNNEMYSRQRSRSCFGCGWQALTSVLPGRSDASSQTRSLARLILHLVYPISMVRGVTLPEEQRT
jgi:hypothetical protein